MSRQAPNRSLSRLAARAVSICVLVKVSTWILGYVLAQSVDFDRANYFGNFAHYTLDARALGTGPPRFLELWNYSDSEWYLSIAAGGYPDHAEITRCEHRTDLPEWSTERYCRAKYAFFPLYPALIAAGATFLPLQVSAFVVTTLVGIAVAACFVWAFAHCFPQRPDEGSVGLALLLLFPFSIFYHLYFSEALFVLLSLLTFGCLWTKRYRSMMACGALLVASRPVGILIVLPLLVGLYRAKREPLGRWLVGGGRIGVPCALLVPAGLLPFALMNLWGTGDWRYFSTVQARWGYDNPALIENVWRNLVWTGGQFWTLHLHKFHSSQIEYLTMLAFAFILAGMWRTREFPRELTLWSTLLWLAPLATKDLMSFGRYMSVSFPVFMFLAFTLPNQARRLLLVLFATGYLAALGGIVRYAWVG